MMQRLSVIVSNSGSGWKRWVNRSTMGRAIATVKSWRWKKTFRATERDSEQVQQEQVEFGRQSTFFRLVVFIDETVRVNLAGLYARALKDGRPPTVIRKTEVRIMNIIGQWHWAVSLPRDLWRRTKWANVSNLCRKRSLSPNLWQGACSDG